MTQLAARPGVGGEARTAERSLQRRAERTVEDVIRTFPVGAPTSVLVERLTRLGLAEPDAHAFLTALERRRRIVGHAGRWTLT